jgi:hypothetical protein
MGARVRIIGALAACVLAAAPAVGIAQPRPCEGLTPDTRVRLSVPERQWSGVVSTVVGAPMGNSLSTAHLRAPSGSHGRPSRGLSEVSAGTCAGLSSWPERPRACGWVRSSPLKRRRTATSTTILSTTASTRTGHVSRPHHRRGSCILRRDVHQDRSVGADSSVRQPNGCAGQSLVLTSRRSKSDALVGMCAARLLHGRSPVRSGAGPATR